MRIPSLRSLSTRLPTLVTAFAAAALGAWLICWQPFSAPEKPSDVCILQLDASTPSDAVLVIQIDEGHGFPGPEGPHSTAIYHGGGAPALTPVCALPPRQICALRIAVTRSPDFVFAGGQIRMQSGQVLARFGPEDLRDVTNAAVTVKKPFTYLHLLQADSACTFVLSLRSPVAVPSGNEPRAIEVCAAVLLLAVLFLLLRAGSWQWRDAAVARRLRRRSAGLLSLARARPNLTLLAVSLLTVVANGFPIVFFGRSLVSPNTLVGLLYDARPTLPGGVAERAEDIGGADVAAMMWAHLPYSVVESRALSHDHEIPLWNRYNSTGISLLGQGQSMLGDPLHLLPLLTGGASWAWDLKFLLAKALLAFGIGLCVRTLTAGLFVPALMAASSVWMGYFAYRFNHPAIFSVCYAPWVLLPWLRIGKASSWRSATSWGAVLVVAEMAEFNSGTAKEATMLLLWMNLTGLAVILFADHTWKAKALRIAIGAWAGILFFLLAAPFWMLFADALRHTTNVYEHPETTQLQPGLFLALFDGLFSQDFAVLEIHVNPSANVLVLAGFLWFLAAWKGKERAGLALALAALGPLVLVFGIVPPAFVDAIPLVGKIQHIHNTFGCVLIVQLLVIAGLGLHRCLVTRGDASWNRDWKRTLLLLALVFAAYLGFTQAVGPKPLLISNAAHTRSVFFTQYAIFVVAALVLAPWTLRWLAARSLRWEGALGLAVCLFVLHFRHGMYLETKFDPYVMNPKLGMNLAVHSPAVEWVEQHAPEPCRVCGFGGNLIAGYNGVLGLEGIGGPDALMNPWYREFYLAADIHLEGGQWQLRVQDDSFGALRPIYDFLNIGYYLRMPVQGPPLPELVPKGRADMDVFQDTRAWPRAFFTDRTARYDSVGTFLKQIYGGDGRPFASVQDESAVPDSAPATNRQIVPAHDYKLTNNSTAFTIEAPGPGDVVLTEAFEEGNFKVTRNGHPTPYFRVNHAFKGLHVDRAGEYRICFSYWPKYLTLSFGVAALGALLTAASLAAIFWKRRFPAWETSPTPAAN